MIKNKVKGSSPINILHVEDSSIDAKIIANTLQESGVNINSIELVTSLKGAVAHLYAHDVDVVLLDLHVDDSFGLASIEAIHAHFSDLAIIVLSGASDEALALKTIKMGAQDYIIKDHISKYTLARSIDYALERKGYERQLFALANTDVLTGLPNRGAMMRFLKTHFARPPIDNSKLCLIYINCDKFKVLNDSMGHMVADDFLRCFARKLQDLASPSDFVARIAGDEFGVVLNVDDREVQPFIQFCRSVLCLFNTGIESENKELLKVSCSIGVAQTDFIHLDKPVETLMNHAVTAMYKVKNDGGDNVSVYDKILEDSSIRRASLLKKASGAFKKGEFYLNHQVIIDAESKKPMGMESLLRWKTCQGEHISPFEFIPILEDTKLIFSVGLWVVRQACLDYLELINKNLLPSNAWVSVNVSPLQLQDRRFSHGVEQILNSTNMPSNCLHLELTETLMIERKDILMRELLKLKALGCRLSMDDFGVGQSSMSYLKDLPFDTLKIDQSFILPFSSKKSEKAILKAMIALAHNLGKKVVAEGVEKKEAAEFLIQEKCDYLQGYYFSRPAELAVVISNLEPSGNLVARCNTVSGL